VGVAVAGLRVAVGGTGVGTGVLVTSGVGVTVGVSVGTGVGDSTGVAVCVEVGVKVGLGVLVWVGVAVGAPMKDVKEQPKRLAITRTVSSMAKTVPTGLVAILNPTVLLSSKKLQYASLTSQGGSRQASRHCGNALVRKSPSDL
jgi:hypothetical protein